MASEWFWLHKSKHAEDEPGKDDDIYTIGTVASVLQLMHVNDGTVKGARRRRGEGAESKNCILTADYYTLPTASTYERQRTTEEKDTEILVRSLLSQFDQYVQLSKKDIAGSDELRSPVSMSPADL